MQRWVFRAPGCVTPDPNGGDPITTSWNLKHPFITGLEPNLYIGKSIGNQLDDEPNLYIGNGWKSPNIHLKLGV